MAVVIETTVGDITVDLFTDRRPQTCKNFLKLCKIKYYNFCLFHSIQANFIAQTGDPSGSGTGGESIFGVVYGEDKKYYEAEKVPKIKHDKPGLLSMVNCGNSMLGSQFFLTLGADLSSLDEHCVFAEVTEGLDVLVKLNDAICDHQHRPYQDIRITHTVILDDPFDDLPGLRVPDASPDINSLELASAGRIGADEKINDEEGLTEAQLEELKAEREAKARATILEIVGDLPDADFAPPENVLFVCKLNPVTSDEDLEIIFSRFGKVKSCEVIRDHATGDSLQYAFVEFEDERSCEQAFLKMDNVLIDDRRIHVDFSQSVSKIRWRGKGKGVQFLDKDDHKDASANGSKHGKRDKERDRDRDVRERDRKPREDDDRDRERRRDDDRRRRGADKDLDDRRRDRRKEDGSRRRDEDGWRAEEERRRTANEDRRRGLEEERRRGAEEDRRRGTEEERRRGAPPEDDRFDDQKRREREERRREEDRRYGNSRRDERRREEDNRRRGTSDKKRNGESSRSERERSKDKAKEPFRSTKDSQKTQNSASSRSKDSDSKKSDDKKDRKVSSDRHETSRKEKPASSTSSHKEKYESPSNRITSSSHSVNSNESSTLKTEGTSRKPQTLEENKIRSEPPDCMNEGAARNDSVPRRDYEVRSLENFQRSEHYDQRSNEYGPDTSYDQSMNDSYGRRTPSVEVDKDSHHSYGSIRKHDDRTEMGSASHKDSVVASDKSKKKKKRKRKSSSSSSSSSSESSDSSSSSSSANRRRKKRSVTVVKKSYHRGKLVKVIKKKKRKSSDSESFSESSDSDRRKKKPKYKKKVIKVIKRKHHSSEDSDSSSSEDSDDSRNARKRKKHEKSSKRKRKDSSKKCKKKRNQEPSEDESSSAENGNYRETGSSKSYKMEHSD